MHADLSSLFYIPSSSNSVNVCQGELSIATREFFFVLGVFFSYVSVVAQFSMQRSQLHFASLRCIYRNATMFLASLSPCTVLWRHIQIRKMF